MPKLRTRTPRMYRDRDRAYVKIDRQRVPLGKWDSPQAQEAYDRLIAEWLAAGRKLPAPTADTEPTTVTELCVAYLQAVKDRQQNHAQAIKCSLRLLRKLYGSESAEAFGPKRLAVLRDHLVKRGLARKTIKGYCQWIIRAFKWASAHELIDARVYRRLMVLEPLREADVSKPTKRIRPVPRSHIRQVRRHLTAPLRALIDLQLLTGARADELVRLAATDLDRTGKVWTFKPGSHKTTHHGKERTIYFGPRSQKILRLFMRPGRPLDKPIFSPRESNAEARRREARGQRRENQKPNPKATDRVIGDAFCTASYRRAIHRACDKAFPVPNHVKSKEERKAWRAAHQWGPHRLRHNAATFLRRQFGLDVASVILGHSSLAITATYAELNDKKAREIIARVG